MLTIARESKRRILLRALEIVGRAPRLARELGCSAAQLEAWVADRAEVPEAYFVRAAQICTSYQPPLLWTPVAAAKSRRPFKH